MIRKIQLLLLAVLATGLTAFGQGTGKIKGKVIDKETGETVPFAGILVEQNGVVKASATTDFDGEFMVSSLTPGKYTVKVKSIGYKELMLEGVVVSDNQITFLDDQLNLTGSDAATLQEVEVVDFSVPLINKDGGSSGGTVTRDDLAKMPGRDATSLAVTVGGVYQDAGSQGGISVRGSRSSSTFYFIDGIKVRGSTNLPKAAIQEVQVITGGLPANYGDATGGIISITTRGPSSYYFGGIDILTSGFAIGGNDLGYGRNVIGLDNYAYSLVEGSLSGPLLMRKDSLGNKTEPILGFFLSGNFLYNLDPRPVHPSVPNWRIKEEYRNELLDPAQLGPLRPTGTGFGAFYNTDFLREDAFETVKWRDNAAQTRASLAGKIDVNTGPNINLTFGGQFDWNQFSNYSYTNSLMNWENNAETRNITWRAYARFTQRFQTSQNEEGSSSTISNAYYTVMVDYSQFSQRVWDPRHQDNIFNYGYVGRFDIYNEPSYEFTDGQRVQTGVNDTLVVFTPDPTNESMAALTDQYFTLYDDVEDNYENLNQILGGNGLRNGDLPDNVYGLWTNIGTNYNGYSLADNTQFRITGSGSADIGDHAITIGFEFEQRTDRGFSVAPIGLWTLMRQLTNFHTDYGRALDTDNPIITQFGTFQQIDYPVLNGSPGEYQGGDQQFFFDYNLRNRLGYNPDGTDFVNVDAEIDPTQFTLEDLNMFSADELLNQGQSYVSYFGYNHYGQKTSDRPSFDDFFTERDEFGNFTRPIAPFEPIYISGYIMDKFAFDDLIFNLGVRVDRFDANQPVLKDAWLLYEAKTVSEVDALAEFGEAHPSNMGDDYIVYVNDVNDPTSINGYRRNNGDGTSIWYDANGVEVLDPTTIYSPAGIAPYLADNVSPSDEISSSAFQDYRPQINVMPRIAFSFPISDEALFFAHYDILTKRPTNGNRLNVLDYFFLQDQNAIVNNPDLRPETTIDYEVGFQQVLTKRSSLKIAAFYREQRNQVALVNYTGAYPETYTSWGNIDFGTVKGMTVSYDLRRTGNIWIRASYTLQFAEGTGSSATSSLNLVNSGQPNLRTIYPYDYDQRHAITATLDYRYGEGSDYNGPMLFGKQILANTGVNIVTQVGSGTPYSQQSNITAAANIVGASGILEGQPSGSRKPGQFRMDMQIDRNILLKFGGTDENPKTANLNIYFQINNVFNTLNIVNVYRATGNPDDDGFIGSPLYNDFIDIQNDAAAYTNYYRMKVNNPFNFGIPRTIRLGVNLNF